MDDRIAAPAALFSDLRDRILEARHEAEPVEARRAGFHLFDGRLPDRGAGARARRIRQLEAFGAELAACDPARLAEADREERIALGADLRRELDELRTERRWERDPVAWLDALAIDDYLAGEWAPLVDRATALCVGLKGVPRYLDDAQDSLDADLDADLVDEAIARCRTWAESVEHDLAEELEDAHGQREDLRRALLQARAQAAAATREFAAFLETRRTA